MSLLIINNEYQNYLIQNEILDLALSNLTLDERVALVFVNQAAKQLLRNSKNYLKIKSMNIYGEIDFYILSNDSIESDVNFTYINENELNALKEKFTRIIEC